MDDSIRKKLDTVLKCLRSLRTDIFTEEFKLQDILAEEFSKAGLDYRKEYRLASRNRIDFLVEGGIGIEVKKGKPCRSSTVQQLRRYAAFDDIKVIILVVERNLSIPDIINGKSCISFGLNRNWGIAL